MRNSTKLILLGVLVIALGLIALINAAVASMAVATLTAIMLLIGGAMQVATGFSVHDRGSKAFAWVMGALMILLGMSFVANPLDGVIALSWVILTLLAAGGMVRIYAAWRLRQTPFFWTLLLTGALSVLLSAYILSSPEATLLLLGTLLGLEMMLSGLGLVLVGRFLRTLEI